MSLNEDRPIERLDDDRLHRRLFAEQVAAYIHSAPVTHGLVVSAMAPWGNGKTSFLNMVVDALRPTGELIVRFNPWMFSGTEQLVSRHLEEIRAVLLSSGDKRYDKAAEALGRYSEALATAGELPVLGEVAKAGRFALRIGRRAAENKQKISGNTPQEMRLSIDEALRTSGKRIVVVIDDVDRLEEQEIREVVRLVRLVADFPNTVYLMAFDRARVERALGEDGHAYLEKIVQAPIDLPGISIGDLTSILFEDLDAAIDGLPVGPFDSAEWQNVFGMSLRPLFRSLRDVRRYVNAVPLALASVGPEVCLNDVLALEAVRVLLPTTYSLLVDAAPALTYTTSGFVAYGPDLRKAALQPAMDRLLTDKTNASAVKELCRIVFPASRTFFENTSYGPDWVSRWRRERRVANPEILEIYLSRTLPAGTIPPSQVARLFEVLGDPVRLSDLLDGSSSEQVERSCGLLEAYEEDFTDDCAAALPVFMNQIPRLRSGNKAMFDVGADMAIQRLLLRIVRRLPEEQRLVAVESALDHTSSLSAKLQLIQLVGHEENIGHGLVDEGDWLPLADNLRAEIGDASASALAEERDLGRLISWQFKDVKAGARAVPGALQDDRVFVRLLRSTLREQYSQTMGELAQRRESVLPWDWLGKLLGADALVERVVSVVAAANLAELDERSVEALATAARYAAGWRPEHFPGAKTGADATDDAGAAQPEQDPDANKQADGDPAE